MRVVAATPLRRGMPMSMRMMSGESAAHSATAASPSAASPTMSKRPASRSPFTSVSRKSWWPSATTSRGTPAGC